jgi:hypothetical protein
LKIRRKWHRISIYKLKTEAHTFNSITWETEARELRVQGQPHLYRNTMSQKKTKTRGGKWQKEKKLRAYGIWGWFSATEKW